MPALQVFAGPLARRRLLEGGLNASDVRVIPAAAGGPKGLILNALDRYLFGDWLAQSDHRVHLIGASIGAWRMASGCLDDPIAALRQLGDDYVEQRYDHEPGKAPTATEVSRAFGAKLAERFDHVVPTILAHPRYRLHIVTSRGRHVLAREGGLRTPLGYAGAYLSNALSRRAMGAWLERVVFSDPRDALPLAVDDYPTQGATLSSENFSAALLASCSIPFWLKAVHDISGAPPGAYWDGGITDYHLHLNYASMNAKAEREPGLVLYPHFQSSVVPGWFDKRLRSRHLASPALTNVVLLAPHPQWVATLPNGKLPDRSDFKTYGDDIDARMRDWRIALQAGEQLADEFASLVSSGRPVVAEPLP